MLRNLKAHGGWLSSCKSLLTPKAISGAENQAAIIATRKQIENLTRQELECITENYQCHGMQLQAADFAITTAMTPLSSKPPARQSEQLLLSSRLSSTTSGRINSAHGGRAKSTTLSLTAIPDLLGQLQTMLTFKNCNDNEEHPSV